MESSVLSPQWLTLLKLLVHAQLFLKRLAGAALHLGVGLLPPLLLLKVDDLSRIAAIPLDETAPMRDLVHKGCDLAPVRLEQLLQLGDASGLLRVKVARVVERLLRRIALLQSFEMSVQTTRVRDQMRAHQVSLEHVDLLSEEGRLRGIDAGLLLGHRQVLLGLLELLRSF